MVIQIILTMMSMTTGQSLISKKNRIQIFMPMIIMVMFLVFAFFIALIVVLSIIPIYLHDESVERTGTIRTTVQLNNYTLSINPSMGKRDLSRLTSGTNMTFDEAQAAMNASIQYALEQQLQAGDTRDRFFIQIAQITPYTDNPLNISVQLDLMIIYTKECLTCDRRRRMIIFQQLCSNNRLANTVQFLINSTNLTYTLSNPLIVYSPFIAIENIVVITQMISSPSQSSTSAPPNETIRMSNRFLANNYTLTVATTKTNYIATLDEVATQISARPNDGPVELIGAITMYPGLLQILERQTQLPNTSITPNITIDDITLHFWYSNSTVQVLIDFMITFPTSCDSECINQRSIQLTNQFISLTNTSLQIQPSNLTDGQVRLIKNGTPLLYSYSLTTQVIANFPGTITNASPPTLTIIY